MEKTAEQKAIQATESLAMLFAMLMYASHYTQSAKIHIAEGFPLINSCSISSEACLSLGSRANYSEMCTYLLAYCTAAQSFHAFTVLPGNDTSLQHSRRLSCKASLVLLVPTQLVQMGSSMPTVAHAVCQAKNKHSSCTIFPV